MTSVDPNLQGEKFWGVNSSCTWCPMRAIFCRFVLLYLKCMCAKFEAKTTHSSGFMNCSTPGCMLPHAFDKSWPTEQRQSSEMLITLVFEQQWKPSFAAIFNYIRGKCVQSFKSKAVMVQEKQPGNSLAGQWIMPMSSSDWQAVVGAMGFDWFVALFWWIFPLNSLVCEIMWLFSP